MRAFCVYCGLPLICLGEGTPAEWCYSPDCGADFSPELARRITAARQAAVAATRGDVPAALVVLRCPTGAERSVEAPLLKVAIDQADRSFIEVTCGGCRAPVFWPVEAGSARRLVAFGLPRVRVKTPDQPVQLIGRRLVESVGRSDRHVLVGTPDWVERLEAELDAGPKR